MILKKILFYTPIKNGGIALAIEEILLVITYFAMASYYLLLGINLLMH
ncbi:hypothetical protein [Methanobrevibacter sp.]|nr:hypothetical protein [Methanobrevibacter sp.]MEE1336697.1 hypothetical protein [Methanobrevibacter sp.]